MAAQSISDDVDKSEVKFQMTSRNYHPVDHGWAWIIMLASFGVHFLSIGYERSFGMLFVEFQEKYDSSSTVTSVINGAKSFVYCFVTLLAMNYGVNRFSVRSICITGCLFQSLSIAASGLLPNTVYLIVTQGILYGCGHALIYCPTLLILSQYFEKKRPIATTLASCGSSVGGIVFPFIIRHLLEMYSLQGSLLLLSGMLLQQLVFIIVYTPPEDYKATKDITGTSSSSVTESSEECDKVEVDLVEKSNMDHNKGLLSHGKGHLPPSLGENIAEDKHTNITIGERLRKKLVPQDLGFISRSHDYIHNLTLGSEMKDAEQNTQMSKSHYILPGSSDHHYHRHRLNHYSHLDTGDSARIFQAFSGSGIDQINASMPSLIFNEISTLNEQLHHPGHPQHHHHSQHLLLKLPQNTDEESKILLSQTSCTNDSSNSSQSDFDQEIKMQDPPTKPCTTIPSVMRLTSFWLLAIFFVCGVVGTGLPAIFIPPLARERGLTVEDAAFFLMISSVAENFGRLVPGIILHFNLVRPSVLIIFPLVVCGVTYHVTPLLHEFDSLMVLTLMYGLLSSSFWSMQTLVVIEVLGLDRLASSIGFYSIFMGLGSAVSFPVSGSLKDITGTYSATFHYFGVLYFIAAAAVLSVHFIKKETKSSEVQELNHGNTIDKHAKNLGL